MKRFLHTSRADVLRGLVIYSSGDSVAALLLGQFSWCRLVGIALVGATVYAVEIPSVFHWIDQVAGESGFATSLKRTGLALLYFNPLWIARHLFFIQLFSCAWSNINFSLVRLGLAAFVANIPIALVANYLIQNAVPLKWRFFASAVFSALMAVYYAASEVLFGSFA